MDAAAGMAGQQRGRSAPSTPHGPPSGVCGHTPPPGGTGGKRFAPYPLNGTVMMGAAGGGGWEGLGRALLGGSRRRRRVLTVEQAARPGVLPVLLQELQRADVRQNPPARAAAADPTVAGLVFRIGLSGLGRILFRRCASPFVHGAGSGINPVR